MVFGIKFFLLILEKMEEIYYDIKTISEELL